MQTTMQSHGTVTTQENGDPASQFAFSKEHLKRRTATASALTFAGRGASIVIQTATSLILARVLVPGDFGLVGMVTPFIAVFTIFGNLGFTSGVLQRKDLTAGQLSALFYTNLGLTLVLTAAFPAAAPFIARLYDTPQAQPIAIVLSLVLLSSGLSSLQMSLAQRALRFDVLLMAELVSQTGSSLLSLWMALNGFGFMALAWRFPAQSLIYAVVLWLRSDWRPGRPDWSDGTRSLMRYGSHTLGFNLLNITGRQGDNVLIGWRYGHVELGPYALAYRLFLMPVQMLTAPLQQVMVPALARLRDEPQRFAHWYLSVLRVIVFLSLPPLIALTLSVDEVVHLVLGPKWEAAIPILRWLLPVGALHVSYVTISWLMMAMGRADRQFRWAVIVIPIHLVAFVVGLPWRAEGVAIAYAVINWALYLPGFLYAIRGTPVRIRPVLSALIPGFATCGAAVAVVLLLYSVAPHMAGSTRLLATISITAAVMVAGACIAFGVEGMMGQARDLVRQYRFPLSEKA